MSKTKAISTLLLAFAATSAVNAKTGFEFKALSDDEKATLEDKFKGAKDVAFDKNNAAIEFDTSKDGLKDIKDDLKAPELLAKINAGLRNKGVKITIKGIVNSDNSDKAFDKDAQIKLNSVKLDGFSTYRIIPSEKTVGIIALGLVVVGGVGYYVYNYTELFGKKAGEGENETEEAKA